MHHATTTARHGRRPQPRRTPPRPAFAVGGVLALVAGGLTGAALDGTGLTATTAALLPWRDVAPDVVAVGDPASSPTASPEATAPPAPARTPTADPTPVTPPTPDPDAVDAQGLTPADREAGLLSLETPASASGELVVVPGSASAPDSGAPVRTVRVEVERGLPIEPGAFAATVMAALNDPRGWGADGSVAFARTDGEADIRVVLASPDQVDAMCAPLRTVGRYSCGRYGHAALNHMRWVTATEEFDDLTQYRQYLVNHEVGHLLGKPHVSCPAPGELAPIMQQQTIEVAPCLPNAWPFPDAS